MSNLTGGTGGGGGAGFALGPAQNEFGAITTTLAAAVTLRDDYATANAGWLAQYDGNGALMVRLLHTGTPGATYYVRAAGAWVTVTAAIEGPRGASGNAGNDGSDGADGTDGTDGAVGAPGGGAMQLLGTFSQTIGSAEDDIWLDLGFEWPTDTDWAVSARTGGNTAVWIYLPHVRAEADGTIGAAPSAAQRYSLNDAGLSGSTNLGHTASGQALIEFSNTHTSVITFDFFEQVPGNENGLQGPQGPAGPAGAAGAAGPAGASDGTFLFGSGVPASTLGSDGDSYLDTDSGTLYKKAAGAWTEEYTITAGTGSGGDHTRYLALGDDRTFVASDYTGGTEFTTSTVTVPTFTTNQYFAIAVPSTDPITTITQLGVIPQDLTTMFTQEAGLTISGRTHDIWISDAVFFPANSGIQLRLS